MTSPLSISGVGNGSQTCRQQLKIPIAIPDGAGGSTLHTMTTPIVTGGEGAQLPGLLGLKSLESQRAILDMGAKRLILPGPADISIELPPGSISIPLDKAPSGHLVMVVDSYAELTAVRGAVAPRSVHLAAFDTPAGADGLPQGVGPAPEARHVSVFSQPPIPHRAGTRMPPPPSPQPKSRPGPTSNNSPTTSSSPASSASGPWFDGNNWRHDQAQVELDHQVYHEAERAEARAVQRMLRGLTSEQIEILSSLGTVELQDRILDARDSRQENLRRIATVPGPPGLRREPRDSPRQ
jgi:hypothetical protein